MNSVKSDSFSKKFSNYWFGTFLVSKNDWLQVWRILFFRSKRVFEEIQPPSTPVLLPAFVVLITASVIPWILVRTVFILIAPNPVMFRGRRSFLPLFESPEPIHQLSTAVSMGMRNFLTLIVIGTYFFVVARCFRLKILWEHWIGFTCWTLIPLALVHSAMSFLSMYGAGANSSSAIIAVAILGTMLLILWTVCLSAQGLRIWTAKGWGFCFGFSVLPYVVYYFDFITSVPTFFHIYI